MKETPSNGEERDGGRFVNCPGPGRPSKRLQALHARYKGESIAEVAQQLADDIPKLESELADIDAQIMDAEAKFLERIAPEVKHRAEVAVTLARARTAKVYVCDPAAFGGFSPTPADDALGQYQEVRRELDAVRSEFGRLLEPEFSRAEAIGDADRWAQLHEFEMLRDRLDELTGREMQARQTAEQLGYAIAPLEDGEEMDGDPFAVRRPGRSEMVTAL